MGDDPTSRLRHRSCLVLVDPSQRTAFPGDFAEFLSRSPVLTASNYRIRHLPLPDPSPKLRSFFYRRSDKVLGMTLPLDFCTTAKLLQTILRRELHFLAILQNSYQDRPCRVAATTELSTHLWRTNSPGSMYGQRHFEGTRRNPASGHLVRTTLYGAGNFAAMKVFAMALCVGSQTLMPTS